MDLHIEKEQLEILKLIIGIIVVVVPIISGFLIALIRKVDIGGRSRVKEIAEMYKEELIAIRNICDLQDFQIKQLNSQQEFYVNRIKTLERELEELRAKLEILKVSDDNRANSILKNFATMIVSLGYTLELSQLCVEYLEGRVELSVVTKKIKEEREEGRGNNL